MPYTTQAEMIALFGEDEIVELTNLHEVSATTINVTKFDQANAKTTALIDSYLGESFALPLPSVPVVLGGVAADILRYYLDTIDPREDVRQRYEDAIKWLQMAAQGKVSLGLDDTGESVATGKQGGYSTQSPVYSRDTVASRLWR